MQVLLDGKERTADTRADKEGFQQHQKHGAYKTKVEIRGIAFEDKAEQLQLRGKDAIEVARNTAGRACNHLIDNIVEGNGGQGQECKAKLGHGARKKNRNQARQQRPEENRKDHRNAEVLIQ